jgi:hypothetical protein
MKTMPSWLDNVSRFRALFQGLEHQGDGLLIIEKRANSLMSEVGYSAQAAML